MSHIVFYLVLAGLVYLFVRLIIAIIRRLEGR